MTRAPAAPPPSEVPVPRGVRTWGPAPRLGPAARACLAALLLAAGLGAVVPAAGADDRTAPGPPDLYAPVLPAERAAVEAETPDLTRYAIAAEITPASDDRPATVAGTLDLRTVNDTEQDRTELFFRLYANDDEYGDGGLALDRVEVAGAEVTPELGVADTVARVPLPAPLAPGAAVDLTVAFTATVPTDPAQSYGIFSTQSESGTLTLAHWYPVLAGYGPDGVPNLDPPSENGDPIFSNTALYDLTLTAPAGLTLVATGTEVTAEPPEDGDSIRRRFVTGPVRDVLVVADDDLASVSEEVAGTVVTSWFSPGNEDGGERVLEYGAAALELFNGLFGPYPYEELDLVEVPIGNGAAGVEFPQLMLIGADYYDDPEPSPQVPGFLEDVVAHEVAHQWWYGLVGNDQYRHAYIDEGLTNYVTAVYFERVRGPAVGAYAVDLYLTCGYLTLLFNGGDQPADQPTDGFPSGESYGIIVYQKAALGFEALRLELGDETFFAALGDYLAEFRFEVATPDDLLGAFEAASGQDLGEFWRHWFQAAEGTEDFTIEDREEVCNAVGR